MLQVRAFEDQDAPALAALLREMAAFYGASIAPELDVATDLRRRSRTLDILVAADGDDLLGFATMTTLYPVAGLLAFTYVQQVYIAQAARRRGVARALMAGIARAAKVAGTTRIEWSTGRDNQAARSLYDGLGARGSNKVYYVLDGAELDTLAAETSQSHPPTPGRDDAEL